MKTYHKIMEIVWLSIGVLSTAFAIFIFANYGFEEDNYFVLAVPVMALVLYGLRRSVRKRQESANTTFKEKK